MRRGTTLVLGLGVLAMAGLAAAAEDPAAVFKAQCAKCHGETGLADTPSGKSLKVKALKADEKVAGMDIAAIVEAMKANPKHKTFIGKLTPEQIEAGATQAKTLATTK